MMGLWKLPELWTRQRTRAHKLLGRRQTAAGAHKLPQPALPGSVLRKPESYTLNYLSRTWPRGGRF
jgi:hypothetical protein